MRIMDRLSIDGYCVYRHHFCTAGCFVLISPLQINEVYLIASIQFVGQHADELQELH